MSRSESVTVGMETKSSRELAQIAIFEMLIRFVHIQVSSPKADLAASHQDA